MLRDAVSKAGRETGDRLEDSGFTTSAAELPLGLSDEDEADTVEGL